jgi:hypothetical protein
MHTTYSVHAGILKPWRGRLPWFPVVFSSYHVFTLPLSGLNWRSLFLPWGSGPPFPKMAPPFTGSAHTPLLGSKTLTIARTFFQYTVLPFLQPWHFLQYDGLSYIPSLSNIAFLTILNVVVGRTSCTVQYMNVETVTVTSSPGPVQFQTPRKLVANPWQSFSPALSSWQLSQSLASFPQLISTSMSISFASHYLLSHGVFSALFPGNICLGIITLSTRL